MYTPKTPHVEPQNGHAKRRGMAMFHIHMGPMSLNDNIIYINVVIKQSVTIWLIGYIIYG